MNIVMHIKFIDGKSSETSFVDVISQGFFLSNLHRKHLNDVLNRYKKDTMIRVNSEISLCLFTTTT